MARRTTSTPKVDPHQNGTEKESKKQIENQNILQKLIYVSLSNLEITFLSLGWILILVAGWYNVYNVSRDHHSTFSKDGWTIKTQFTQHLLPFEADNTDHEWNIFSSTLLHTIPWILFHCFISQILKKVEKKHLLPFNLFISIAYMMQVIGAKPTVWMFCQPLAMFVVHLAGSSFLVWITALLFLFVDDAVFFVVVAARSPWECATIWEHI